MKYRWDDFLLDLDGFRLLRADVPLALEPKAFNLLALLVQRPGHVFTKQEIFERLWPGTVVTDHALTRVVAQLRRALGDDAREGRYIETVPTRGYRWLPAVTPVESAEETGSIAAAAPVAPQPRPFPLVTLALTAAIVLMAIAAWTQVGTRSAALAVTSATATDVAWPIQLTTNAGLDMDPAFSPHGDAVAFASDRSGAFELFVRALNGTANEIALTSDGQQNVQPAWSPDGSLIAFHSHSRGGIWVMPARGGVPRQVASQGSHPSWSPDGHRIAFESDEPSDVSPSAFGAQSGSTLQIVDADGRNLRALTTAGQPLGGHASPAWTSDGRFIAFSVFEGGRNNGVWLLTLDTGKTTHLIEGFRNHYELAFAPDDSALFVAGGEPFVTRAAFDRQTGALAGKPELITVPGVPSVRGLTVSPDGTRVGFSGLTVSSQIWAQPIGADGTGRGDAYPLTTDTSRRNSKPVVSPDGSRVAYVSTRSGEAPNVWIIGADGRNSVQMTANESPDVEPYWFADGGRLAFLSTRDGELGLWSVDLDTRRQERMHSLDAIAASIRTTGNGPLAEPSLSSTMNTLAMSVITPPGSIRRIFLSPTSAAQPRVLSADSPWLGYPAWSRDDRWISAELKDGSSTHAAVIEVATGTVRQITRERGQTWVRSWSPDGKKIAAAVFRGGQWSQQWIDAASGATGTITAAESPHIYMRYPDWSPRGNIVAYERGELRGNVWMLSVAR